MLGMKYHFSIIGHCEVKFAEWLKIWLRSITMGSILRRPNSYFYDVLVREDIIHD